MAHESLDEVEIRRVIGPAAPPARSPDSGAERPPAHDTKNVVAGHNDKPTRDAENVDAALNGKAGVHWK